MNYLWNILALQDSPGLLWLLCITAAKATLLLGCAALLSLLCRRFSAATRHLLWASTLCASLLLPFLSFIKVWEVPILPARISETEIFSAKGLAADEGAPDIPMAQRPRGLPVSAEESAGLRPVAEFQAGAQPQRAAVGPKFIAQSEKESASLLRQLADALLALWAVGVLLLLFRLIVGLVATNSLASNAAEFKDPALRELFAALRAELNLKSTIRLLRSEDTSMPIVCGILRPSILLPADAEDWPEERRRMVLLHELTHVARRDCLTQMMAQAACALYWFNPLIWSAARRLRVEREKACDDYVLSIGTRPSDYAHHLLEIARSMRERSIFTWSQTVSVAMARRSQLEGRLLSILSKEKKRGAVSRTATCGLVALTALLLFSLGALRPTLTNARSSHASQTSSDEQERAALALPDSPASGAEHGADAAAYAAKMREGAKAEESGIAVSVNPPEPPGPAQTKGLETDSGITENIVQVISEKSVTSTQAPEVRPQASVEAQPSQDKSVDFIEEMAAAGYTNLSVDELVRLKNTGVTLDYVQSLRALGFANLTTKELSSMSANQVTPAYIKSILAAGYNELTAKEMTTFRIHDITPEYIRALRGAGYAELTARQLIDFAVHGVTPSFIKEIGAVGYSNLTPKELVSLRVFSITPEFIRKARSRLGELTVKQLVTLKSTDIIEDDKDGGV